MKLGLLSTCSVIRIKPNDRTSTRKRLCKVRINQIMLSQFLLSLPKARNFRYYKTRTKCNNEYKIGHENRVVRLSGLFHHSLFGDVLVAVAGASCFAYLPISK